MSYDAIIAHRAHEIGKNHPGYDTTNWLQAEQEYNHDQVKLKLILDKMGKEELTDLISEATKKRSHNYERVGGDGN